MSSKGFTQWRHSRQRANKYRVANTLTRAEWRAMLDAAAGVCHYCRRFVGTRGLTIEHVIPFWLGGPNTRENVRPACAECNSRRNVAAWARELAKWERWAPATEERGAGEGEVSKRTRRLIRRISPPAPASTSGAGWHLPECRGVGRCDCAVQVDAMVASARAQGLQVFEVCRDPANCPCGGRE